MKNMNIAKKISIIIPVYGFGKYLKTLLSSIKKSRDQFDGESEVIIVDGKPNKENEDIVQSFNYKYLKCSDDESINASRNMGIKSAQYPIILFVDSDCRLEENLLNQHYLTYLNCKNPRIGAVLGLTLFEGKKKFGFKIMDQTPFTISFQFANLMEKVPWGTCTNLSILKSTLDNIRNFSSDWPMKIGGEDVDLGIKINLSGYEIITNKEAIVYHTSETWSSFKTNCKKVWTWGKSDFHLFAKYPHIQNPDIPSSISISFILAFFILFFFLTNPHKYALLFFILILIFNYILQILFQAFLKREENIKLLHLFFAEIIYSIFKLGFIYEGMKNLKIKPIYSMTSHSLNQVSYGWGNKVKKVWSQLYSLFISLFILFILIKVF